jgi:hypothetical protein
LLVASAAAFGVGLIAFTGSAGAVVPSCTPPTTTTNDSCVKLNVTPANPGGTAKAARLFVRTHTNFEDPGNTAAGGEAKTVTLDFDNDFALNQGAVAGTCSEAEVAGKTIAQAYNVCGPPAGSTNNAYLSTQIGLTGFGCNTATHPCVSGQANAAPGINACTLAFKGPAVSGVPTITLFARAPIPASGTGQSCDDSPTTLTSGTSTVVLSGKITTSPLAGFGKRLTVPNIDTKSPLPLIDFYAYVKRSNYFTAKCSASPWRMRVNWVYSGTGQAPDTFVASQACS